MDCFTTKRISRLTSTTWISTATTHFILEYPAQPELRHRVRQELLKSEQWHALAQSVFYGKLGRADWRDFHRQMSTASCLLILLAAVVYWQIREIERVLGEFDPENNGPVDLLAHIRPISRDNVVLYGGSLYTASPATTSTIASVTHDRSSGLMTKGGITQPRFLNGLTQTPRLTNSCSMACMSTGSLSSTTPVAPNTRTSATCSKSRQDPYTLGCDKHRRTLRDPIEGYLERWLC